MHAVDGRRHRRAQIGAVVVPVRQPQRADDALIVVGRLHARDAVRRSAGGRQMLEPILDPFDRPPGDPGADAEDDDVWEQSEL
jgi:hypothetical protein